MKIEHVQYFVDVARKGSISAAAKSMFMSPQGMSEAIQQLEKYIGFPLFIRQNRGVTLTENGEQFFNKAQILLDIYQDTLSCAQRLEHDYRLSPKKQTLLINPIFFRAAVDILYNADLISMFNLYESGISQSIQQLQSHFANMAIVLITDTELAIFEKNLPTELTAIELFEDEIGVCALSNSPYYHFSAVDDTDSSILFIEHPSSYYDYFSNTSGTASTIRSSDIFTHIKLMKHNNAVCVCTRKLMYLTYSNESDLIFIPFSTKKTGKFYLIYNNTITDKSFTTAIKQIADTLQQGIDNFLSETI